MDPEIKKIEAGIIDFLVNTPLFMGEKLIFSTLKAYFITRETLTQKDLREITGYSSGAISQELQKLLERGLIEITNVSTTGKKTYSMKSILKSLLNFYLSQFEDISKWNKTIDAIKLDLDENKDELIELNGYDTIYRWITLFQSALPLTTMVFTLMEEEIKTLEKKD